MVDNPGDSTSRPTTVAVLGLKNTGKTTAAAVLISGLSARGLRVAAVKSSHLPRLELDPRGRDSRELYDAGALCVVAQGREETLIVRRHARPAPFSELLALMPANLDFVVMEGCGAHWADAVILCLRSLAELEETLRVRNVPAHRVRAVTGLVAADLPAGGTSRQLGPRTAGATAPGPWSPPVLRQVAIHGAAPVPILDAAEPRGREQLIQLVLTATAEPDSR